MKPITVISYKFGEKTWKNFEGEPIKKSLSPFLELEKNDSSKIFRSVT